MQLDRSIIQPPSSSGVEASGSSGGKAATSGEKKAGNSAGLKDFLSRQANEIFRNPFKSPDERVTAYREQVGKRDPEVSNETLDSFTNSLLREYSSIQDRVKEATTAGNEVNLTPWEELLIKTVEHKFKTTHSEYTIEDKKPHEIVSAYHAVFSQALRSGDPEEASQWRALAMMATKRQIMALQLATGAHNRVLIEGQKVEHVSDIHTMSAVLSKESGRPIDQVQREMSWISKFLTGVKYANLDQGDYVGRFARWIYTNDPGRKIRFEDNHQMIALWNRYQAEASKRIHSDTDVTFDNNAVFDDNRGLQYLPVQGAPQQPPMHLDATQKQYLKGLPKIGTTTAGESLEKSAQDEADVLLTSMTKSLQDYYYSNFGVQLLTENQLNLARLQGNQYVNNFSGEAPVQTHIDGLSTIPIGLEGTTLDTQMDQVMRMIDQRTERELMDKRVTDGVVKNNVENQINQLTSKKGEYSLPEARQKERSDLETAKTLLSVQQGLVELYDTDDATRIRLEQDIRAKEAEYQDMIQSEAHTENAQKDKEAAERAERDLTARKTKTEQEITSLTQRKQTLETEITNLDRQREELRVGNRSDTASVARLNIEVTAEEDIYNDRNRSPSERQLAHERILLKEHEKDEAQKRIDAFTQREPYLDQQIKGKENKITNEINPQLTAKQDEIDGNQNIPGLKREIQDAKDRQTEAERRIAELSSEITNNPKRAELDRLNQQLKEIRKQLATKLIQIRNKMSAGEVVVQRDEQITNAAQRQQILEQLKTLVKEKGQSIAEIDVEKATALLGIEHQLAVLNLFNSEVLANGKWTAIQNRARKPLTEQADAAAAGTDSFAEHSMGKKNRPDVPAAYLRLVQIMAGKGALVRDSNGDASYGNITRLIPPDMFYQVFIGAENRRVALSRVSGIDLVDFNLPHTMYDSRLLNPEVQKEMIKYIDKDFMNDLLAKMITDAEQGELGRLTNNQVEQLRRIKQLEPDVAENEVDQRREQHTTQVESAKDAYTIASSDYKVAAVARVTDYVTATLGLQPDQVTAVMKAVRRAVIAKQINDDVHPVTYAAMSADIAQIFQEEGVPLADDDQRREAVNTVRFMSLVQADFDQIARVNEFNNAFQTGGLNVAHRQEIMTDLRIFVRDNRNVITSIPIDVVKLDEQITNTPIRDLLKNIVGNQNIGDNDLIEVVNSLYRATQRTYDNATTIETITRDFLKNEGTFNDGILLNTFLAHADTDLANILNQAMYNLQSREKPPFTIDKLFAQVQDSQLRTFIQSRWQHMQAVMLVTYAQGENMTLAAMAALNWQEINGNKVLKYAPVVLSWYRSRAIVNQPDVVNNEREKYGSLSEAIAKRENLERQIQFFSKRYWGYADEKLALRRELEHGDKGDDTTRREAIRLAREVKKHRAKKPVATQ